MKQINTYYPKESEKELIEKAAMIVGLKPATFVRSIAIIESRKILRENKLEESC